MIPAHDHPGATANFMEAIEWYGVRDQDAAQRFIDTIDSSIGLMENWPESAPRHKTATPTRNIRTLKVAGFPYRIIYCVQENDIVVLAYSHDRRNPDYWQDRLDAI